MTETIAVYDPFVIIQRVSFKRDALIFNRIAVPNLGEMFLDNKGYEEEPEFINELEWLINKGILYEPVIDRNTPVKNPEYKSARKLLSKQARDLVSLMCGDEIVKRVEAISNEDDKEAIREEVKDSFTNNPEKLLEVVQTEKFLTKLAETVGNTTRLCCVRMREIDRIDAYPVLFADLPSGGQTEADKQDVIQIVLNALPIPDDSVSWEQIIEYRSDPESYDRFLDLRNWMNEVARAKLTPIEVEQKLEHLMSLYTRHMNTHKIKINNGTIETVLVTGSEIVEELIRIKPSKAIKALYAARHRRIALVEGELKSPGSEVAYIVKARDTFK